MNIRQVLDSVNARRLHNLLTSLYHRIGPGRKPYSPLPMLKAQLLKHLLRIPARAWGQEAGGALQEAVERGAPL